MLCKGCTIFFYTFLSPARDTCPCSRTHLDYITGNCAQGVELSDDMLYVTWSVTFSLTVLYFFRQLYFGECFRVRVIYGKSARTEGGVIRSVMCTDGVVCCWQAIKWNLLKYSICTWFWDSLDLMNCCRGCVRRTVIDIAVSNGRGWAVCLSILSPKHVNESSFRSVFCSEYRTIAKVQERNGSQWYRQHSLFRTLQFLLWLPLISAGLLDGVASSMGDDHRELCLKWCRMLKPAIWEFNLRLGQDRKKVKIGLNQFLIHDLRQRTPRIYSTSLPLERGDDSEMPLFSDTWNADFSIFWFPYTTQIIISKIFLSLYYIKDQQNATLAVLFISHCKITLHVRVSKVGCHCSGNRPWTSSQDIYYPDPWHAPGAANTVFNTPNDGRRKRPKRVE
jgi:hypothetical protein